MSHKIYEYVVVIVLLMLAVGVFTYMENCGGNMGETTVEPFINKNNVGGTYNRFDMGIIQGGGGYPFV